MFFDETKTKTRPMKRRQMNALLAAWDKELRQQAAERLACESAFDPDGFLKINSSFGFNSHRRGGYRLSA